MQQINALIQHSISANKNERQQGKVQLHTHKYALGVNDIEAIFCIQSESHFRL